MKDVMKTALGTVALLMAGGMAVPEADAQSAHSDWNRSYQFPTAQQKFNTLLQADLIKRAEDGYYKQWQKFITNNYKIDDVNIGSINNSTSIGNQTIIDQDCTDATCQVTDNQLDQTNVGSDQTSQNNQVSNEQDGGIANDQNINF